MYMICCCVCSGCSEFEHRVFGAQHNSYFCFATGCVSEEPWLTPFLSIHPGFVCVCIELRGGTVVHIWRYFVPHCHCYTVALLCVSINDLEIVVCWQLVTKCCKLIVFLHQRWSNKHNCNCTWSTTSCCGFIRTCASHKIFQTFRCPFSRKLNRVFCHCCIYYVMHLAHTSCHKFAEEM